MRVFGLLVVLLLLSAAAAWPWLSVRGAEQGEPQRPPPPLIPDAPKGPAGAPEEQAPLLPAALDIKLNETLVYEIRWNGVLSGRAVLRVRRREAYEGHDCWKIHLDTYSTRLLSALSLYPVRDKARSIVDVKGGFSRSFTLEKAEGAFQYEERVKFDYALDKMEAYFELPRPDGQWRLHTLPLEGRVLDPLAAFYYLRSADLAKRLPIITEGRVWNTRIRQLGRETLSLPAIGRAQPCLVIVPEAGFSGLFERRSEIKIWLHEATRVPVKMAVEIPIGPCEALLALHKNSPFGAAYGLDEDPPLKP